VTLGFASARHEDDRCRVCELLARMHGMLLSVRSGRKTSFKIHFQAAANRSDRRLVCYASPQRAIATTAVAELLGRKLWWHPVKGRRPLDREAQRITPEASSHCEPTSGGPCAPVRAARFWILYAPFFRASATRADLLPTDRRRRILHPPSPAPNPQRTVLNPAPPSPR
jgi:hypothetical protein